MLSFYIDYRNKFFFSLRNVDLGCDLKTAFPLFELQTPNRARRCKEAGTWTLLKSLVVMWL